jgi:hypothetical protein
MQFVRTEEKIMRIFRKTLGSVAAAALVLSMWAGPAASENSNLTELAPLLALPVMTSSEGGLFTEIVVTNAAAASRNLHIIVISADSEDNWSESDFDCPVTANETVRFSIAEHPSVNGDSEIWFECNEFGQEPGSGQRSEQITAQLGIMVVATEIDGASSSGNDLFGDATILDLSDGVAYSVDAIPFQGGPAFLNDGDRDYEFDGSEYMEFPMTLATNYVALGNCGGDSDHIGAQSLELFLFTLDGTLNLDFGPEARVRVRAFDDDENSPSTQDIFVDCAEVIDITEINESIFACDDSSGGSVAGHVQLTPVDSQFGAQPLHDADFGNGDGFRKIPIHGWVIQRYSDGDSGQVAGGRPLTSIADMGVIPRNGDDKPVLRANPN